MNKDIKYKKFETFLYEDEAKIASWLHKFKIINYKINDDKSVDVDGDVNLNAKDVHQFRVQFGIVNGNFDASLCKLKTLLGSPREVTGNFLVSGNSIESLEYSPRKVGGNFYCNRNKIKSLVGGPVKVGGTYGCFYNSLENFEGAPIECETLIASNNKMKSLKGSPRFIKTNFFLSQNLLCDLEGGPEYVGEKYDVSKNNLKSLKGIARHIGESLDVSSNELEYVDFCFENELTKKVSIYENLWGEEINKKISIDTNEFKRLHMIFSLNQNLPEKSGLKKHKI